MIHVGDTFMGVRLVNVDRKTGVATTTAGEIHETTSFKAPSQP